MKNHSGLNIKGPTRETKNIIDISDSEMDQQKDQSTSQKATPSQEINLKTGKNKKTKSNPSPSEPSKPNSEPRMISSQDLPDELLSSIGAALGIAHFALWIPNAVSTAITITEIVELPPGSAIILIFPDTHSGDLPDGFETGQSFIIPT